MKVLFVDDEQLILNGLRRMLRSQRKRWEISFATGADEALEIMGKRDIEVVVSDMRMPVTDGAQLLAEVRQRHPKACRVILSGHSEQDAALRAACVAHQFLSKPCSSEDVIHVIETAQMLQELIEGSELRELITDIESLPPAPQVHAQLSQLLSRPEVDLDELHQIIRGDLGVSSKMLQLVNSSFFGIAQGCCDLRQALMFLGLETIGALVLAAEVFKGDSRLGQSRAYSCDEEQRLALDTFRIAEALAADLGGVENVGLTAMLHRLGKLILASRRPEEYDGAVDQAARSGGCTCEAERDAFGASQGFVGAYLLGLWGMPLEVVHAVAHHERPSQGDAINPDLLGLIHVASALSGARDEEHARGRVDSEFLENWGRAGDLDRWLRELPWKSDTDAEAA